MCYQLIQLAPGSYDLVLDGKVILTCSIRARIMLRPLPARTEF